MSKDLFEQKIGEALRSAESTPPTGAWELIKSQIGVPATPPFKFPTWAVVTVSAAMLGTVSLSESFQGEKDSDAMAATSVEYVLDDSENILPNSTKRIEIVTVEEAVEETALQLEPVNSQDLTNNDFVESVKVTEKKAVEFIPVEKTEVATENVVSSSDPVKIEKTKPIDVSVPALLGGDASRNALSMKEPTETRKDEKLSVEAEKAVLAVDGKQICYTPCELKLEAKGNAEEYSWDAGAFGLVQGKALAITIEEPQTFTVYATGVYEDGSELIQPRIIEVKEGSKIFAPNSFSPNGDGQNDNYMVQGSGIESFSMTIVNSYGNTVFQTDNIDQAWNFDPTGSVGTNEKHMAVIRAVGVDGKVHNVSLPIRIFP